MKKSFMFAMIFAFLACSQTVYAEEKAVLGKGLALKIDYIDFTDSFVKDNGISKSVYLAVEGYAHVAPEIFLGLEAGIASPSGTVGNQKTDLTYVPVELNAKYINEFWPNINLGIGGGMSANYVDETVVSGGSAFKKTSWLLGGQIFAELLFVSGNYFAGFNAKYQFTDNVVGSGGAVPAHRYSNWRLGGLGGMYF